MFDAQTFTNEGENRQTGVTVHLTVPQSHTREETDVREKENPYNYTQYSTSYIKITESKLMSFIYIFAVFLSYFIYLFYLF